MPKTNCLVKAVGFLYKFDVSSFLSLLVAVSGQDIRRMSPNWLAGFTLQSAPSSSYRRPIFLGMQQVFIYGAEVTFVIMSIALFLDSHNCMEISWLNILCDEIMWWIFYVMNILCFIFVSFIVFWGGFL